MHATTIYQKTFRDTVIKNTCVNTFSTVSATKDYETSSKNLRNILKKEQVKGVIQITVCKFVLFK